MNIEALYMFFHHFFYYFVQKCVNGSYLSYVPVVRLN